MGIETPFEHVGQPLPAEEGIPAKTIVSIAGTFEEVEAMRDAWQRLLVGNIDSEIDYYLAVARNAEQVVAPCVVHIRREGRQDLMVIARLENLPVRLQFAYWAFSKVKLRAIVVTFDGVLGA
jgi:hypothetical protein